MKAIVFLCLLTVSLATVNAQDYLTAPQLERKEGVMYIKGSDTPFSGDYNMNHDNGKIFIKGQYVNGLKEGKWVVYDSLGALRSEEAFAKDQWEGERKTYHPNGKISTTESFKAGIRNGLHQGFYENGQLIFKVNEVNGHKVGSWVYYHNNGKAWEKGQFKANKHEGKWTTYDGNGKTTSVRKYKEGKQISGPVMEANK